MNPSTLWRSNSEAVIYTVLMLMILGTVNIFSASFVLASQEFHDSYYFLKRHLSAMAIGFCFFLLFARSDYRNMKKWIPFWILLTLVLLAAVFFTGVEANGARRWLRLGFMQFQPSELAKLTAILMAAGYLGPKIDRERKITLISAPIILAVIMFAIVLKQPDMGTAMVIFGLCFGLYFVAGIPKSQLIMAGAAAIPLVIYFIYNAGYRSDRITAWLNPWQYQDTIGYQTVQSLLAIGSGGFWGSGLGMGASKFHYLPEAHTDFAFAVVCQEMGFIGAVIILFLIALLALFGIKIALKALDGFGMMVALGVVGLVVGQAAINIAMVSGVFPVTGVPLPFISYGGSSLIINMAAIGLLVSVGRRATGHVPLPQSAEKLTERVARRRGLRVIK